MKAKTKKKLIGAALLGGTLTAGYMYVKGHPNMMSDMKHTAKDMAKMAYEKLDDVE